MGTQLRQYETLKPIPYKDYDWVNKLNKTIFFYDLCHTVTDYHYIYDENYNEIFSYSEYNDYTPEEGGYTDEQWKEIKDFMKYENDCEEMPITGLERENFYRQI